VKWYYKSGQVATEVLYINGRKDGLEKWYYESGQLKYEVPYVDGKRNGAAKWYSESGVITSLTPYVDDKIDGVLINYDMGYCTLYENDSMVDDDYPCP
jgi:antitoxin component YwqK of YwqJK toxin-antitoxin module